MLNVTITRNDDNLGVQFISLCRNGERIAGVWLQPNEVAIVSYIPTAPTDVFALKGPATCAFVTQEASPIPDDDDDDDEPDTVDEPIFCPRSE